MENIELRFNSAHLNFLPNSVNHLHRAVVEEVASAVVDLLAICPLVLELVEAATNAHSILV